MPLDPVTIVVPTYNERDNLPRLVDGIAAHLDRPWELVVVDDGSPDGTADVARALAGKYPVRVVQRSGKQGLGSAYREGMRQARPGPAIAMDADLSHDPRFIPALVKAVDGGADLALGSRYVPGGSVVGWTLRRKATSRGANLLARAILGLRVKDATTGFRCYGPRARALLQTTQSDGYAFQIEAIHLSERHGLRVREVPIEFKDREVGESKLGSQEILKFLGTLRRLRATSTRLPAPAAPVPRRT